MRTCFLIFAVITIVSAAYRPIDDRPAQYRYPYYYGYSQDTPSTGYNSEDFSVGEYNDDVKETDTSSVTEVQREDNEEERDTQPDGDAEEEKVSDGFADSESEKKIDDKEETDTEKEEVEDEKEIYDLNDAPQLFEKFIKDYDKKYDSKDDYDKHYLNFVESLKNINEVNSSGRSYTAGINLFSDISDEEFANSFTGALLG